MSKTRTLVVFALLLIPIIALPLLLFARQRSTELRSKAQEVINVQPSPTPEPIVLSEVPGSVIVKFKSAPTFRPVSGQTSVEPNHLDVSFSDIDPTSLSPGLQKLQKTRPPKRIARMFKDDEPRARFEKLKATLASDIASGQRHINESKLLAADFSRTYQLSFDTVADAEAAISELKNSPDVEAVGPNFVARADVVPNDPLYAQQYAHQQTAMESGWDITQGDPSIKIAIIDTGVDVSHEDLKGNLNGDCTQGCPPGGGFDEVDIDTAAYLARGFYLYPGEDYTVPDSLPADVAGHGTHVAGIAAATGNNGIGVSGVCPRCQLLPVRAGFVIKRTFFDYALLEYDDVARAILYAVDNGARIISMSFGGPRDDVLLKPVLDYATNAGVLLIAAAGNANMRNVTRAYPSAYDNVVAVTATDETNRKAAFSNFGFWTDVAAPGVNILSTVPTGGSIADPTGYRSLSGTSMSTPYVSGFAGLVFAAHPTWTTADVTTIVRLGVDNPVSDVYIGTGRVNAAKTLSYTSVPQGVGQISSPTTEQFLSASVDVVGTADGDGYILYRGLGYYPNTWTQIGSGGPVANGLLGRFNTDGVTEGLYGLKLAVTRAGLVTDAYAYVMVDKSIHAGWPKEISLPMLFSDKDNAFTPTLADVNTDGIQDIVLHTNVEDLAMRHDGTFLDYWPTAVRPPVYAKEWLQVPGPAVGDLNRDCIPEVATGMINHPFGTACFNVFDRYGRPLSFLSPTPARWPQACTSGNADRRIAYDKPVIMADLDGDGTREVIALDWLQFLNATLSRVRVNVFNADGTNFQQWPYDVDPAYDLNNGNISVADLDHDGKTEVIGLLMNRNIDQSSTHHLFVWNYDGTLKSGYPKGARDGSSSGVDNGVVLVDIDQDGQLEVPLVTSVGTCFFANRGELRYLNLDGTLVSSFAKAVFTKRFGPDGVSVGDLDRDGNIETVFGTGAADGCSDTSYNVYVFKNNGLVLSGWPQTALGQITSQATIGDITGDGYPDVVVSTTAGRVYAWERNGSLIAGFPKIMHPGDSSVSGVSIGDVDGDGKVELVSASQQGSVYVWDVDAPYRTETMQWPMYQHDQYQTGNYTQSLAPPPLPGTQCTVTPTPSPTLGASPTPSVVPSATPTPGLTSIRHRQTVVGGSSNASSVSTSSSLSAEKNHLYVASISTRKRVNVEQVVGLGLTWKKRVAQCSGRNSTGIELWTAIGSPTGSGVVKAKLSSSPDNAVISVSRYSRINAATPIGQVVSANTNGLNGACTGGTDSKTYSSVMDILTNSGIYNAAAIRKATHTPGTGFVERSEKRKGDEAGEIAGIATEDTLVAPGGLNEVNGSLSTATDWATATLELRGQ